MDQTKTWLEAGVERGAITKQDGIYYVHPAHCEIFTSTAAAALKETLEAIIGDDDMLAGPSWSDLICRQMTVVANDTDPACACGVKFTGGLHSSWCPCFEAA